MIDLNNQLNSNMMRKYNISTQRSLSPSHSKGRPPKHESITERMAKDIQSQLRAGKE